MHPAIQLLTATAITTAGRALAPAAAIAIAVAAGPAPAQDAPSGDRPAARYETTPAYDLLFREGTLDAVPRDAALVYQRDVTSPLAGESAGRSSGRIALSFPRGDGGGGDRAAPETASLEFSRDGQHRDMGSFPASVGNPMIMVFYEGVVRDMAEAAGGSPFYIRNRIKDALVRPARIVSDTAPFEGRRIDVRQVTMRPFDGDPNADRMRGFGELEMTVTMSDEVPGWYLSLVAEAPGPDGQGPVYRSELTFEDLETGK